MSKEIFTNIYNNHSWGGVSKSGPGSDLEQTKNLIETLPKLFTKYDIKTFLDAPCGDFHWMQFVDKSNINYIGGDIVSNVISTNKNNFETDVVSFLELDIINDKLPKADIIFVRDCLVHFPITSIYKFLFNLISSDIKYLMTTTFVDRNINYDINFGEWRQLNLLTVPFNFPKPLEIINEGCTENDNSNSDKSMCLWNVSDIKKLLLRVR